MIYEVRDEPDDLPIWRGAMARPLTLASQIP
ncbi:hypothetical protein SAMN05444389_11443 [Paracoccus solventivorans]|uniref:Uncharacterized protein n=1 Tax=Paracoccus solventivorans TaxID=53463 RepID=A0A1M7JWQ0_9RHOB|nr:hypothetical protein SAMN05444389_11443 [Paracoccus solventivorans]